jgi:hypothetical protein
MTGKASRHARGRTPAEAGPWTRERFLREAVEWLPDLSRKVPVEAIRRAVLDRVNRIHFETYAEDKGLHDLDLVVVRDCARAWRGLLHPRSERITGTRTLQALVDAARGVPRDDLSPAFWAEACHLVRGVEGRERLHDGDSLEVPAGLSGRGAARPGPRDPGPGDPAPRLHRPHARRRRSEGRTRSCDFMLESDTSPIDLVTRRYPAIAILKPFNTCPQICVYCQRNWEIEQAMAPGALAPQQKRSSTSRSPGSAPARHQGGAGHRRRPARPGRQPAAGILDGLADIPHVDLIRIGSRVPVTVPMRIDDELAASWARTASSAGARSRW